MNPPTPSLFTLLKPYKLLIGLLVVLTLFSNACNLAVPKIIANAIDTYASGQLVLQSLVIQFSIVAILIFIFTYLQSLVQVYASERVARDIRNTLAAKISVQPYAYIEHVTPEKLLTNLTSDVDALKTFVSTAIASLISSVFLIVGTSVLLLLIDWALALAVLSVVPIIAVTFFYVLRRVRKLFTESQEAVDWLNKVINESILGAALIRLLHSKDIEYEKFLVTSTEAKRVSLAILTLFSSLVPVITFLTNLATLTIVLLGGHFVIQGAMTLGSFTAFNSYLAILIFPILIIGFMSNVLAQATASYGRISEVLFAPEEEETGGLEVTLRGHVEVRHVGLSFGEKTVLKDVSFFVPAGSKTAIIGPTAAGKTQLLYVLTGLLPPTTGAILYDDRDISAYNKESLHSQVGFVFQDSVIFNLSLRENIAFGATVLDIHLDKAIQAAELGDFVQGLEQKLETMVSERGTNLSGGQKQRIMLARALALNPKILLLDDFTSRVDPKTEKKILQNIAKLYPHLTLISVTQKISSIELYDQIVLLMEGEVLAKGTHIELLESSLEYAQIYASQRSMRQYE